MTPRAAWSELGLNRDADAAAVRQVYADRLRGMDPDTDPAAFARLRASRDVALADIRRRASSALAPADLDLAEDWDGDASDIEATSAWPHAAPRIDRPVSPDHITSRGDAPPPPDRPAAVPASGPADEPLILHKFPFGPPVIAMPAQGDVMADRGRGAALQQLLTEAAPDVPFDDATEQRARDHLDALVRIAGNLPIGKSRELEDGIAELLSRNWPRSAPLLAPASTAFGWDGEYGQIGERPAVAFLNARLGGLRFVDAVQQPGHPFHKAWTELLKPGFRRSRMIKIADMRALLEGIRKDFPEVEQYLDVERVAAWEQKIYSSRRFIDVLKGMRWSWLLLLVFGIRLWIAVGQTLTSYTPAPFHMPFPQVDQTATIANFDHAAPTWFGNDADFKTVAQRAPLVARLAIHFAAGTHDQPSADRAFRDAVFAALHFAAINGDSQTLRDVQRLRLGVLSRIPAQDAAACMEMMESNRLPYVTDLTPPEIEHARRLLDALAQSGSLNGNLTHAKMTATIPGVMIKQIMSSEHLSEPEVRTALRHEGSDALQCAVSKGLMKQALRLPPREGDPILRIE